MYQKFSSHCFVWTYIILRYECMGKKLTYVNGIYTDTDSLPSKLSGLCCIHLQHIGYYITLWFFIPCWPHLQRCILAQSVVCNNLAVIRLKNLSTGLVCITAMWILTTLNFVTYRNFKTFISCWADTSNLYSTGYMPRFMRWKQHGIHLSSFSVLQESWGISSLCSI
jgi:hypothetical protein